MSFLSLEQAAQSLKLSQKALRTHIASNDLVAERSSGVLGIPEKEVERLRRDGLPRDEAKRVVAPVADVEAARKWMPNLGEWTRRVIVFAVMGSAFIAPTLGPMIDETLAVNYLYNEEARWIFSYEKLKIMTMKGITILPLHTHMAACIGGFYFGTKVGR